MGNVIPKGLDGLLNEAPDLVKKVTYQQFLKNPHDKTSAECSMENAVTSRTGSAD